MRVAVVAESFLPAVNGVTHSVLRAVEHLNRRGHESVVVAPSPGLMGGGHRAIERTVAAPIVWMPAVSLPGYRSFRVSPVGVGRIRGVLREIAPDVVHLASPFVLGWDAVRAARLLDLPTVAVYQTEVPTYAVRYGFGGLQPLLWRRVCDIHGRAHRTLAPSTAACAQLRDRGVPEVRWWGRGVDLDRFSPQRRSSRLRARVGPPDAVVVGYVGRLAVEKQLEDLAVLRNWTSYAWWSSATARCALAWSDCCRAPSSSGSLAELTWRLGWPAWTSASTPASTRPSARPCRKSSPPVCR